MGLELELDLLDGILVMGVSGSGKSTTGKRLADKLGWIFVEADEFHPAANRAKMSRGEPLTDDDRWPWLAALSSRLASLASSGQRYVVACSALKQIYRVALIPNHAARTAIVFLSLEPAMAKARVAQRSGHFFPLALVESQFAILEAPLAGLHIDASKPPDGVVEEIVLRLTGEQAKGLSRSSASDSSWPDTSNKKTA